MPLPPLITTTPEGRRVYPCDLVINKQRLFFSQWRRIKGNKGKNW